MAGELRCAAAAAGQGAGPVEAIGLTGQMHGAVFLDGDGQVIRPAILWNDQRTAAECAEIERAVGAERLRQIAGNPALTGFQAPKVLWLRHNEPAAYARVRPLLLPKDFIRFRLTGALASDASDAAGTLLLDLAARDWSDEILAALDDPARLAAAGLRGARRSPARSPARVLRRPVCREGLPVVAGGGDNAAAAVGCGVVRAGTGFVSLGTSGVVFVPSDDARDRPERRSARVLPRRARPVPPDGRDPLGRRQPALVSRRDRRRAGGGRHAAASIRTTS